LRGKRGAFTSLDSLSGYLAPMAYLKENHIRSIDLGEVIMAGNHSSALALLDSGYVDFAATYSAALQEFIRKKPGVQFKTLAIISGLPSDVLTASPSLSSDTLSKLKESFEQIFDPQGPNDVQAALKNIGVSGVAEIDEKTFDNIGRWLNE